MTTHDERPQRIPSDRSRRTHVGRTHVGLALGLGVLGSLTFTACFGGGGGSSATRMSIDEASNGFGRLLPYRIYQADPSGLPTNKLLEIRTVKTLETNATLTNPVLPPTEWPTTAVLPNGDAGSHYIYAKFTQPIDIDSVLDSSTGGTVNSGLTGTITVQEVDPVLGTITPIPGRGFVGGFTYGSVDPDNPSQLLLEKWLGVANGLPIALDVNGTKPGVGFPGTQSTMNFAGAADLVSPNTFVFVPDADGNLATHETFTPGVQIRMTISSGVLAKNGNKLGDIGVASSTVGADTVPPEVAVSGAGQVPNIVPGNGDIDVDPQTTIKVQFSEPIQVRTIAEFDDGTSPALSAAIQLKFGPQTGRVDVPYHIRVASPYDLTNVELVPTYNFPGSGPNIDGLSCGDFSTIDEIVNSGQFVDLNANANTLAPSTFFVTAEGPGLVNAPVTPDTIYVNRGGSRPGISVIDLNGFGQGPGDPTYNILDPIEEGHTNFPNDPNVALQASLMIPALSPGSCIFDGGSPGVFSLAKDTALNDRLISSPLIVSPSDMAIGHPLDMSFNNALPFGCQAGGGNICAQTGLKVIQIASGGPSTLAPAGNLNVIVKTVFGAENLASWSPHPNPPPFIFPPLCLSPLLASQEPSSVDLNLMLPPVQNLLTPGSSPLGQPNFNLPPNGLLTKEQNVFFQGPSPPQTQIQSCNNYAIRQQIGHYLYVADPVANELVVVNSNRFTILDRIPMPDPTSLAMSPNLDLLAVSNSKADLVTFVDTDPASSSFHQIVKQTIVGRGPTGIAWESGNEDIFVCNTADSSVSVISAFSLNVRKTLTNQIQSPIDVALTPRQTTFGFLRGVYYGYILNSNGSVAVFESGPDGVNGIGFDEIIGTPPFRFPRPKAIQPDITDLRSGIIVVHEDPLDSEGNPTGLGGGAVSAMAITSGTTGQIPLDPGAFTNPQIRDLQWSIKYSVGEGPNGLTGIPTDVCIDDQRNLTPLTNFATVYSAGTPLNINGKSIVKVASGAVSTAANPQFLFLSVPLSNEGPGVVDVIDLSGLRRYDTNPFLDGVQSVPCSDAISLCDYFRQ